MNKIKSLFKASPIAMAVVSLVIAGVASAAIVSYISNAPTAAVTVSAPVAMGIYEGVKDSGNKTGDAEITLTPTYGGSYMSFTTTAKNQANNKIGGYYVTVIAAEGNDKITGKEFTSMMFDKNKGSGNPQNGEIIDKLCVVKGDGTLMKLADYSANGSQKLILLLDIDGDSEQASTNTNGDVVEESTAGICSPLTLYGEPNTVWTETRSFFHLNADETETWTFTPTWNEGATGIFTISAQYVNDLAKYAAEQYK